MSDARHSVPDPVFRCLRVFAVDPGTDTRVAGGLRNEMTLRIPWERDLAPGPCGEYVTIVDVDEDGRTVHPPLDLNDPDVLACGGVAPSDGDPRFRQQMPFAVAMATIDNFERALGRPVHWAPTRRTPRAQPAYRRRLAIHPHYRQEAEAWYRRDVGVCLGYAGLNGGGPESPERTVFTCLSQDVVAHSIVHAVLDGLHVAFEGGGPDVEALGEAYADLIALLQHFGEGDALRAQIGAIRGDLRACSLLGAVAPQLGAALQRPNGVRNALGTTGPDGRWSPREPDPALYGTVTEPHDRGDLLVAAVFLAFTTIYEARVADLRRIASRGTGVLPDGALHPDLVDRLAREAAASARHVQHMCIRALDYLPPVDATFGDFLRAVLTADHDLVPRDAGRDRRYRTAFQDAFSRYGIEPAPGGTVSVDTLLWSPPDPRDDHGVVQRYLIGLSRKVSFWTLPRDREELWTLEQGWRRGLEKALRDAAEHHPCLGPVDLRKRFDVVSLDLRERTGAADDVRLLWVVKVVQRAGRGQTAGVGCTLIADAANCRVRYRIDKAPDAATRRTNDLVGRADTIRPSRPAERALRVFASDPTLGAELATAGLNEVTLRIPWEGAGGPPLSRGPVGEYLEVIDHDPASGCFYEPVDLDDRRILAQDGLTPSESNPQFHQQMVYAVMMRVIRDFEEALGRRALWSPHRAPRGLTEHFVRRLRVHPHALREANAYYSPAKKALLFGYFTAAEASEGSGGQTVFTCLSHDIVAHETTHALLDGMHRRFTEPSNPDVYAFHEAFADIVALFEHFSLPEAVRDQIADTRGDLGSQNRLGELAQQFGAATGRRSALRSAIGSTNPDTGKWEPITPDPRAYARETEPHARGSILVAAVFDAFLTIYKSRVADLLRIATDGTGVLPAGQLHPDLVGRMADEAARAARRVLHMCIRALDYCPPVDVTFGDYLRALVTADFEVDAPDSEHRRVAFAEAFRRYGIVPEGVRTLSVDGLLWRPTQAAPDEDERILVGLVRDWAVDIASFDQDRAELFELMERRRAALHEYLVNSMRDPSRVLSRIDMGRPFEIHSIRPSLGRDWSGRPRFNWIVEITQGAPLDPADADRPRRLWSGVFRGGTTLVLDAATGKVRYSIRKPVDDDARRERQRRYQLDGDGGAQGVAALAATYYAARSGDYREPFAMLHRW